MRKTTSAIRYINDTTAQVTKAFMKQASIFGTDEFKLWREYKKEFPAAKMITKDIKKNPNQKTRRNMTFANMETFINTRTDAKDLMDEFETVKKRSKIQKSPYQYVLEWFETKFEGYDDLDTFMKEKDAERTAAEKAKSANLEKLAAAVQNAVQNEENKTLTLTPMTA